MTMGEEMLRLGGVAVIAVSIALVLKNQRPELDCRCLSLRA